MRLKAVPAALLYIVGLLAVSLGNPYGFLLLFAGILATGLPYQARLCAFPTNCEGRIFSVTPSNGCTLTRASIQGMTPNDFEANGLKEIGMDKWYQNAREARLAGYRENSLQSLLMSRITNIKGQLTKTSIPGSPSIILPFITRRQKRNINNNYWKVASGKACPKAGTGDIPPSAWDIVIQNNPSAYATTLQNLHQYFLPGTYLFVEYANASSKVAYQLSYKILAAATVAGVTTVTVQPNYSDGGWDALTAAEKLPFQIGGVGGGNAVAGTIAYLGVNSVSDYESWGGQDNAEQSNSFLNYFLQTSRIVHEYTDEYLKALNAALTGGYYKDFMNMPLAEQKRIQQAKFDKKLLNSAFYGQRINELQTVEGYRNLPKVYDPANPSCVLEYKSNALGFMTQLADCSRVLDHQGNAINLDTLFATLYTLKRAREADGGEVDTIDCMTDRFTAGKIQDIMNAFYKSKYGVVNNRNYQPNQELTYQNQVMLKYNRYQLPPELGGFDLAVFTHPYFDDKLSAAASADHARTLWFLDWSDIELGVAGTNSAVRKTNEADELYEYTISINSKHVTLNSMTWTPIIEDPNRHYVTKNFTNACPTLTVSGCTVTTP